MLNNQYYYCLLVLLCLGCTPSNNKSSNTEKSSEDTTKKGRPSLSSIDRKIDSMKRKYAPIPEAMLPQYLTTDTVSLEVSYVTWGCACPPWIMLKKRQWCDEQKESYRKYVFYLEPADTSNVIDKTKLDKDKILKVRGVFYKAERFPKGFRHWKQIGVISPAKVFRYHSYEVKTKANN